MQISLMKKLTVLLVIVEVFVACNHRSDTDTNPIDSGQQKKNDSAIVGNGEQSPGDSTAGYTWSKAEQTRFLKDCDKEFDETISNSKRKDFCNCVLTEGQKYYSSYKQMQDNGDDEHDEEISKKCLEEFMDENDE